MEEEGDQQDSARFLAVLILTDGNRLSSLHATDVEAASAIDAYQETLVRGCEAVSVLSDCTFCRCNKSTHVGEPQLAQSVCVLANAHSSAPPMRRPSTSRAWCMYYEPPLPLWEVTHPQNIWRQTRHAMIFGPLQATREEEGPSHEANFGGEDSAVAAATALLQALPGTDAQKAQRRIERTRAAAHEQARPNRAQ